MLQGAPKTYCSLSATKQRLINELVITHLCTIDEEDFVFITERGVTVLNATIDGFNTAIKIPQIP